MPRDVGHRQTCLRPPRHSVVAHGSGTGPHDGESTNLEQILKFTFRTPGTPVIVAGLTASPQSNDRPASSRRPRPGEWPGRLVVLLDGDTKPTSLREAKLRKDDDDGVAGGASSAGGVGAGAAHKASSIVDGKHVHCVGNLRRRQPQPVRHVGRPLRSLV